MLINIQRLPVVQSTMGLSRSSIYGHIAQGLFPKPIHIGSRAVGWPSHEVQMLINARISGSTEEAIRQLVIDLTAKRSEMA